MTLTQMRHFQAVCRHHNNLTRAAATLHISQPSVSNSIRELEQRYGVNLFHRVNKRLTLTREGELFLQRVDEILRMADELDETMYGLGDRHGKVRIGVPPMIGTFLFPALFEAFHQDHPQVELEITEHGSVRIRQMVRDEELELAMAIIDEDDKDLKQLHLMETDLRFCVHPEHSLAGRQQVAWRELAGQPLILFKDDSHQNATLLERFRQCGVKPNILLTSSQLYTIRRFVQQGRAGAFLFREIADMEPGVVGIPLGDPISIEISLIWKRGRILSSDAAKFIQTVKNNGWFPVKYSELS